MQKKILIIDPISSIGHVNYNTIIINEIKKHNRNIYCIFKEDYDENLFYNNKVILRIPNKYYNNKQKYLQSIINRINQYKIYRYILKKIDIYKYDVVILTSYEEISLYYANINKKLYLINHNNLSNINNKIKIYYIKKISSLHIHVVLHKSYLIKYIEYGINNVICINHGLKEKIIIDKNYHYDAIKKYRQYCNYDSIIFMPINNNTNIKIIEVLLNNKEFISYITINRILIVVKCGNNKIKILKNDNILIITDYMTKSEYEYTFYMAKIVVLCYKNDFKYRISNVFLECAINNKICIMNDIQSFKIYHNNINYKSYYKDVKQLYENIKYGIEGYDSIKTSLYADINEYQINISKIPVI